MADSDLTSAINTGGGAQVGGDEERIALGHGDNMLARLFIQLSAEDRFAGLLNICVG